jgi:hypothetical protein
MDDNTYKKTSKISMDTVKLLEISRPFNDDVDEIRKKYKIKVKNRTSNMPMSAAEILENDKGDGFKHDIMEILIRNKIPNNYFFALLEKILYDKFISIPASSYSIALSATNIHIVVYQKPTKLEWNDIKKEVEQLISSNTEYMRKFNYPNGTKVRRPKKDIDKTIDVLKMVQAGASNTDIEFEKYYDENAEMNKNVDKRNVGKIKSKKRRYNELL